jgi:phthiocerol/phenolphthiocerol synthesis type-I polyketide synthase E
MTDDPDSGHIAVIGLACRLPRAQNPEEFWRNLVDGVDAITRLPRRRLPSPNGSGEEYVPAGGFLTDPEWLDARYFGYSPREARIIDPQQRVFLECAVEALEDAGCDPGRYRGPIGVYAGGADTEYAAILRSRRAELPGVTNWEIRVATATDFLGTRVAYKLGLRGPAVAIRAACATSLVAVHVAVQGLLAGDCDVALAGGACVHFPAVPGEYTEGGIISPDGACRTFDAGARGIVAGNGAGLAVLKRLPDALEDGDRIRAVIRGSAVNNDGADRIGYTAPTVDGQADVIRTAHLVAGVHPDTITYVEAHGTATPLGDPIEVAALTKAFGAAGRLPGSCGLGSVKTNIGHTDAAAGIAGLIKTVMALENGLIPPNLHFSEPNPQIDFSAGPFRVETSPRTWRGNGAAPRRAGVSSFGMGGTNAHVVLEEAPVRPVTAYRPHQLLLLSAATPAALDAVTARLAGHLRSHPRLSLASVAWTLQVGRRQLPYRRYALADGIEDAVSALTDNDAAQLVTFGSPARSRTVAFLFPGTSDAGPSRSDPDFRRTVAELCDADHASAFEWEHALARLWARWGVIPDAVLGVGSGVLAAAAVADGLPTRIPAFFADDISGADDALSMFLRDPNTVLLEVGTRRTLTSHVLSHTTRSAEHVVIPGMADELSMLSAAGRLWLAGVPIEWEAAHGGQRPMKVALPTYPFERRRYVVGPPGDTRSADAPVTAVAERLVTSDVPQVVAGLFGELLGLGPGDFDHDESFFDLGGDSLVATKFLVQVRRIYPVELALRSMFQAPTVGAFATLIEEQLRERAESDQNAIR